jgi:adenylate cyclase
MWIKSTESTVKQTAHRCDLERLEDLVLIKMYSKLFEPRSRGHVALSPRCSVFSYAALDWRSDPQQIADMESRQHWMGSISESTFFDEATRALRVLVQAYRSELQ